MKKIISLSVMIAMIICCFVGCGGEEKVEAPTDGTVADIPIKASESITIESCRFTKEVTAIDGEYVGNSFSEIDGKVYVDTVITVETSSKTLTEDDFSGYVIYDDLRHDFQYEAESYTCTGFASGEDDIKENTFGRVHLFCRVPKEAMYGDKLTANITICGENYTKEVDPIDTRDALSKKTELKKGDKEKLLNGNIEFEVIDCKYTKYLQASDTKNTEQYSGSKPFVDCTVKITNHLPSTFTDFLSYIIIDGEIIRGDIQIETENNTKLKDLSAVGLKTDKTEIIHIINSVDENVDESQRVIRFNIAGKCFYCKAD